MQLRAAQRRLPGEHPVSAELDQAVERIEHIVTDLRRLAHGVRPASLNDGLPAALRQLGADCPVAVEIDIDLDGSENLSEIVATTAYFVAAEAVANALKHARAGGIHVTASRTGHQLLIRVSDDGGGGVPTELGLTALHDRVGSIGGQLTVTSARQAGTTIEAVLPCVL